MTTKEDKFLTALLEDKILRCSRNQIITYSNFLDMRQCSIADRLAMSERGIHCKFYGGYEEASRVIAVFLPEYIEQTPEEYYADHPEENPVTILRSTLKKGAPELSHRDYLGALMGLGIRREMVGDILVRREGADLIVMREVAPYLCISMFKAGRSNLSLSEVAVEELIVPPLRIDPVRKTVSSLRLDSVIAAVFGLSRSRASAAISAGIVFVNGMEAHRGEKHVERGDKLVVRGRGKAVLKTVEGRSNKGRIAIIVDRYL